MTHGYRRIGLAVRLSASICCRQSNSHDPEGMLTGLVHRAIAVTSPPCQMAHRVGVSCSLVSCCQPLDDCTGRRLRLLVQAFKGTSHNDLAVPRKVSLLSSVSIRYLSLPLVHSPNAIRAVPALATSHTRLLCAFGELPVSHPRYISHPKLCFARPSCH